MLCCSQDADGWWFITKDDEKGLVPGSYLKLHNPVAVHVPDAAMLAAREASNQRLVQMSGRSSLGSSHGSRGSDDSAVDYNSSLRLEGISLDDTSNPQAPKGPASVDAKASDMDRKPTVRKLRKCHACRETILGRTKTAKGEIFHEIVRIVLLGILNSLYCLVTLWTHTLCDSVSVYCVLAAASPLRKRRTSHSSRRRRFTPTAPRTSNTAAFATRYDQRIFSLALVMRYILFLSNDL